MNIYPLISLVVALVSLVLAAVTNQLANPSYLMLVAIWLAMFFTGSWSLPWRS